MSFQSKSLAGLDCQSSKWSRSSWKQCCVVTCPEVSYIHRHIQYHLIQDAPQNEETSSQSTSHSSHLILLTQIDLVSASDLATLKGKTLQECTNANQLQWWTWILLSHPSCSARKSYCLRQLRPDRVSNRPRQWIIMLLSNSGKNEKNWFPNGHTNRPQKWIHLKLNWWREALMLRTYEKRFFLLREVQCNTLAAAASQYDSEVAFI